MGLIHPWREFRERESIALRWQHSDDEYGHVNFDDACVTLSKGMTQAERRCTIVHEMIHLDRGPVPPEMEEAEEVIVRDLAARRLIPLEALIEALLWSRDEHELAGELWVDEQTIRDRLKGLSAADRLYIEHELDRREQRMA